MLLRIAGWLLRVSLLMSLPLAAAAQGYPSKPIRIVLGYSTGGSSDTLGRMISEKLGAAFGQSVLIDNRPGASGNIATESVVKSPPDGHTLLMVALSAVVNATLYPNLSFNFLRDIAPVATISRNLFVLVVHPSVPARTGPEFLAYAKANPGKIRLALTDPGSAPHASGELFRMMTGIDLAVVRYTGGGPVALKGTIEGQSELMFEPLSASIEPLRSGKLRALAVTAATRSPALPDLPVIGDFVPGYEASAVSGIGVPKNTPPEIIATLNAAVNAGFADPVMKARLADTGGSTLAGSPADFGRLMAEETEKWAKVVRFSAAGPR